jgi:hypothetical protein
MKIDHVPSSLQQVDMLIKPLTHIRYAYNREKLGIKPLSRTYNI